VKTDLLHTGLLEQCLKHVEIYPDEEVDTEIMSSSLELLSLSVPKNKKNLKFFHSRNGLEKILFQLRIIIDVLNNNSNAGEEQVVVMEKLLEAASKMIFGNSKLQDQGKDILVHLARYIQKGLENKFTHRVYSEDTISSILNLIVNIIDTNQTNQISFIKSIDVPTFVKVILYQKLSFKISGLGCLLLSHLVWNNVIAQEVFT